MNFDRYTQKSLEAVKSAQQLAQQNGQQQLEQIHLLAPIPSDMQALMDECFFIKRAKGVTS